MKFKICWIECTEKTGKELKDYMKYLPVTSRITGRYLVGEGLTEIECVDTFEAKGIHKAKKYVEDNYIIPDNVFTVTNADTGKILFTEED